MFKELEKNGTPVSGYPVKIVDEIDLTGTEKIDGLKGGDGMELSDITIEGPREATHVYADEENLYWCGTIYKDDFKELEEREEWFSLGRTLDHISSVVANHRLFDRLDDNMKFKVLEEDERIKILCIMEK